LSYSRYDYDAGRLLDVIQGVLAKIRDQEEADRKAQAEADRKAQEEADRKAREDADRQAREKPAQDQSPIVSSPQVVRADGKVYLARVRRPGDRSRQRSIDEAADLLARAVRDQWTGAAAERRLQPELIPVQWARSAQPVTGPVSAAVGSRQFPPLPGLAAVRQAQVRKGGLGDLHALYGGLGSGRMVIIGAPGSGKTGAAIVLVLDALKHREQVPVKDRPLVPVPVLFTLHGWNPNTERAGDWLIAQLQQTYPFLAGTGGAAGAAALLGAGRVAVILDGLDEIPDELRPVALRALSQQAAFRIVVLTRSAEMAAAARRSFLEGSVAVELQDVGPLAAAGYLARVQRDPPPHGWDELTGRLRHAPDSPLAKALSNPLTLTLVRDTYRDADAGELLGFCDAAGDGLSREDVEDYLLDRVLPIAYTARPGEAPPRYELQVAQRTLTYMAVRMNQDGARDLAWWHIPAWTPRIPRIIAGGLVTGLGFGLLGGLIGLILSPNLAQTGSVIGLGSGLVAGLVAGLGARGGGPPGRMAPLRWRQLFSRSSLLTGLVAGLVGWLVFGLAAGLFAGLQQGAEFGLFFGLAAGLLAGLASGIGESTAGPSARVALLQLRQLFSPSSLLTGLVALLGFGLAAVLLSGRIEEPSRRAVGVDLLFGLLVWFVFGLVAALSTGLTRPEATDTSPLTPLASWRRDRTSGLTAGLVGGLVAGLVFGLGFGFSSQFAFGGITGLGGALVTGLAFCLVPGVLAGLVFGLTHSQTWAVSLTFVQLALRQHTPVRLMRFLEDARERHVLRTVGPVYQFRHARLHDRLGGQANMTTRPQPPTSQAALEKVRRNP
jgi:hypothetical protein